jgi:Predicted periplasmic or secreted lipoprotein
MKYVSLLARTAFLAVILVSLPAFAGAASTADAELAKAVSHELMEGKQPFDATDIIVSAEDGVVHLRGSVENATEVDPMKSAAMRVPGVKDVETLINVKEYQKGD